MCKLPPAYNVLTSLVSQLPFALAEGSFCSLVNNATDELQKLDAVILAETDLEVLQRVHSLYGFLGRGFLCEKNDYGVCIVPAFISAGWLAVSDRVGRHPTLDYVDYVLYNWTKIDPNGGITTENIRLLNRFTGLVDEEWFWKNKVIIESEASGVVSSAYAASEAVAAGDADALLKQLEIFEGEMAQVAARLTIIFKRQKVDEEVCDPHIFHCAVQPLLNSWSGVFKGSCDKKEELEVLQKQLASVEALASGKFPDLEPHRLHLQESIEALQKQVKFYGPTDAMSCLLPCCEALLGIVPSEPLQKRRRNLETYMPPEHREFVNRIHPARGFCLDLHNTRGVEAQALVNVFNACVESVLTFRWKELSYVQTYEVAPAVDTPDGAAAVVSVLNQQIHDTEEAFIRLSSFVRTPSSYSLYPVFLSPSDNLWSVTSANGLLPMRLPVDWNDLPPPGWDAACELIRLLPAACVPPGSFRHLVNERLRELPEDVEGLAEDDQERGRAILAFLVAGWFAAGPPVGQVDTPPPERLQAPFDVLSKRLQRAPRLGLVDMVLYNWTPKNEPQDSGEEDLQSSEAQFAPSRILPQQVFLCVREEEWFIQLHVSLAGTMGRVIKNIDSCMSALDVPTQVSSMQSLCRNLEILTRIHEKEGIDSSGSVKVGQASASLLMTRWHRFLWRAPEELMDDAAAAHFLEVYSATGIAQTCVLLFLGVEEGDHMFSRYRTWREGDHGDLPVDHRAYVRQLRQWGGLRSRILGLTTTLSVPETSQVELAFNACVDRTIRFFQRRWNLACTMCSKAVATLQSDYDQERHLIMESRLRLLDVRQNLLR